MRKINQVLKKVHASISITGTLGNEFVYKALTGLNFLKPRVLKLPSPYDKEKIRVYVVKGVSSKFQHRTADNYQRVIDIIKEVLENTKSNAALYVPSYTLIDKLIENGLDKNKLNRPVLFATSGMTSNETDKLIDKFISYKDKGGALLVGAMNGRVSEGTDFKGNALEIVFTFGIPYIPKSTQIESRINYFNSIFPGFGWEICYGSPAWQKLTQCTGRPLRSLSDRAFIVMMDERIISSIKNEKRIPQWLQNSIEVVEYDPKYLGDQAKQFFK